MCATSLPDGIFLGSESNFCLVCVANLFSKLEMSVCPVLSIRKVFNYSLKMFCACLYLKVYKEHAIIFEYCFQEKSSWSHLMTVLAWLGLKMVKNQAEPSFTVQVYAVMSECRPLLKIGCKIFNGRSFNHFLCWEILVNSYYPYLLQYNFYSNF